MKKYQFGIVGCGVIAPLHAQAIAALPNAVLRGAVSSKIADTKEFVGRFGGIAYSSFQAMLQDPEIDVVCICTPSLLHAPQAIAALRSGKHVVLEKPMALNTAEADEIIRVCREENRLLTVIFQSRFSEDIRTLKRLLEENAFGTITSVNLIMNYWRDEAYFRDSNWRGRLACEGGGALTNQGIHGIDLLVYLLGMPQVLAATVQTMVHSVEVEDSASALIRFPNGASGIIQGSTCCWPGFPRKLTICGSKGFAVLRENRLEQLETPETKLDLRNKLDSGIKSYQKADSNECYGHTAQIGNLLDALEGKDSLFIDGEEGRKSLRVIEEIYRLGR